MLGRVVVALAGLGALTAAALLLTVGCGGTTTSAPDPTPYCLLTPAQLDFDSVTVGQVGDRALTIKNAGEGTLTGSATEDCARYTILSGGGEFSLTAGQERTVMVRFAPSVAERQTCVISLGGAGCGSVPCTGIGSPSVPLPGGMALVPAGAFLMGSPGSELGRANNEDQHQITLTKAFYVSVNEITQTTWFTVMGWNESSLHGPRSPVSDITWYDCLAFCNELSEADGFTPAYTLTGEARAGNHITAATVNWDRSANGYRLLTEAEWEYACRAETSTAFHSGSITNAACAEPNLDLVGWYCGNASGVAHDVGQRVANGWGLRDMHGNAREWCWDRYGEYPAGPAADPEGPASGTERVTRGGSWNHHARFCRAACRSQGDPGSGDHVVGFRLARTAL